MEGQDPKMILYNSFSINVVILIISEFQGHLSGLCGNFDSVTVNDMTTSSHMEVNNAQTFGDSWALGQVSDLRPHLSSLYPVCFPCLSLSPSLTHSFTLSLSLCCICNL